MLTKISMLRRCVSSRKRPESATSTSICSIRTAACSTIRDDCVISIAYFALISADRLLEAGTDAAEANWWPVEKLPALAFDHHEIVTYALERIRNKLKCKAMGFQLLPEKLTLTEFQTCLLAQSFSPAVVRRTIHIVTNYWYQVLPGVQ